MDPAEALLDADRVARGTALDVTRSFIVQAPAGSGKTALLIQRYLKLLAVVGDPEEIVAITFTRKAAAEMRLRVLRALDSAQRGAAAEMPHEAVTIDAACAALARNRQRGWRLTEFPRRMRIQTLDAFCTGITRSLPLSSALGGTPTIAADQAMRAMYRGAARATLDWLVGRGAVRRAVEQVLRHLDNDTAVYIDHVARMLERRDQWLGFVGTGAFGTESALSVRRKLEQGIGAAITSRLERVRNLLPAALVDPLRNLVGYAADNLSRTEPDHPLAASWRIGSLPDATPDGATGWKGVAGLLLTRDGNWRKSVNKNDGFPPRDRSQKKAFVELLRALSDRHELRRHLHDLRRLPPPRYSDAQWEVLIALLRLLPVAVSELRRMFSEHGAVDHIEIALAASFALGTPDAPGELSLKLDYQVRHLLVDEMQDTSVSQYQLLESLIAGWEAGDGRTLFCVGDPMQSIYRFRDAEVGRFLLARDQGIAGLSLKALRLRRNFRSGESLVRWCNRAFAAAFPADDDVFAGAIAYSEAVSAAGRSDDGRVRIHPVLGYDPELEARRGVEVIRECLRRSADESIAILVRSRAHLPPLLRALRRANIAYQALEIDRLSDLPEIIDLLALTRALCHPGDRVAWLGLLRGPWVGIPWKDLHRIVMNDSASTVWELLQSDAAIAKLSDQSAARLRAFRDAMEPLLIANLGQSLRDRVEAAWFALGGPALLGEGAQVDSVYRFLDVLETRESRGTLADVAALQSLLDEEYVASAPRRDCRVQIMTMHRAKGLEFDHVLLYGLGRTTRGSRKSVLSWLNIPVQDGFGDMIISPVGSQTAVDDDPLHRFIERAEGDKDRLEWDRLLYVACTRARQSLHLLGHVGIGTDGMRPPPAHSLLSRIWPSVEADFIAAYRGERPAGDPRIEARLINPELRRFAAPYRLPNAPELPAGAGQPPGSEADGSEDPIDYYWVGAAGRHAGTIVHRWLQKIADGSLPLSFDAARELRGINRRWAQRLGVGEDRIDEVCDRVETALERILVDPKGRWALEGDGHAELALTGRWKGRLESAVIDRVRVDDDGVHWVIDFKTSAHEGGDLAGFLDREAARYGAQMEKYAGLYRSLTGAPVRAALYFPLLQEFREITL